MSTITILLGRTRDRRRRAIGALTRLGPAAAGRPLSMDPLGRPDFLFVTDSVRKKATVQQEFIAYRGGASFLPEVATLTELQDRLATRWVGSRTVWSEGAIAVWLAHHLPAVAPDWLLAIAPPARLATQVARAFTTWESANRPDLPGERGQRLTPLLRKIAGALDADPARSTRHTALVRLIQALENPSAPLVRWLRRTALVVVDDLVNPAALDRAVLGALTRAWATAGTRVVISFESGCTGREDPESLYFGIAEGDERVSRTLAATARLRRSVFDGLIAEYGADVVFAGPEYDAEEPDPTDVWGTEATATAAALTLTTWPEPETEVRAIAHRVRELLEAGVPASDIWVAFPGLPSYAGSVRRIFGEVGVPFTLSRGEPALAAPGVRTVLAAVRAAKRLDEPDIVLDALSGARIAALPPAVIAQLARRTREGGIGRCSPQIWSARLRGSVGERRKASVAGADVGALNAEVDRLNALQTAVSPGAWIEALNAVARAWGLTAADGDPTGHSVPGTGLALSMADDLAADTHISGVDLNGEALGELLAARVQEATVRERGLLEGSVAVVGMLELRGIHPPHLFIGGLSADDFPGGGSEDWLFDSACREALESTDGMAQARYLLGSALRNALNTPGHHIALSWPRIRGGRTVLVSPVVTELLEVRDAEGPLRDRVVQGDLPAGRYGIDEWRRYAASRPDSAWLAKLGSDLVNAALPVRARQALSFGEYDGQTGSPPKPGAISITAFEAFLACPARFFYDQVLGVESEEPWDPDLSASAHGSLLHRVLQRFLRMAMVAGQPSLQTQDPTARAALARWLHEAATAELESGPAMAALKPSQREWILHQWCSGLTDGGPEGILASWLAYEANCSPTRVRAVELELEVALGPLRLRGRADRVDELGESSLLVLDHKTGKVPNEQVRLGLRIQGVLYARALAEESRPDVIAGYAAIRGPGQVDRGGWSGPADGEIPGKLTLPTDGPEGDRLSAWLEAAAARMGGGEFHPTVAEERLAGCEWCAYRTVCRVDPVRAAAIVRNAPGTVQAPFGDPQ